MERDSISKVINSYMAAVCREAFTYLGRTYSPKLLAISPLIFRDYTCPANCGACCLHFTLDYLPSERRPYEMATRVVEISGRPITIYTDHQDDHSEHFCRNLERSTGRCRIHGLHPFSCDFELLRFIHTESSATAMQKLYGRGWKMLRVDGGRGARCEVVPAGEWTLSETVKKFERLREWADHLGIVTWCEEIIAWLAVGPHAEPLVLDPAPVAQLNFGPDEEGIHHLEGGSTVP